MNKNPQQSKNFIKETDVEKNQMKILELKNTITKIRVQWVDSTQNGG